MSTLPKPLLDPHTIWNWVDNHCPAEHTEILKRPSAETYPNTFVVMFSGTGLPTGMTKIFLDVHYVGDKIEGGQPLQALGGLWATGFIGALKPEQEGTGVQKLSLIAHIGHTSPDPTGLNNYGMY